MKLFLLSFSLLLSTFVFSQSPETIIDSVKENYTPEKIYIQYDKQNYLVGETMWFKAYLMEGYLPAVKSTVIAIELMNDSGRVIEKKILPIVGSAAIGDFVLPKTLYEGIYTIRAYTKQLMNFGTTNFYTHALNIFNPEKRNTKIPEESVYFFPEGGNFVAGTQNTVAFKCTDQAGMPQAVEGKISDSKGKDVAGLISSHDGMGKFDFIPLAGETYLATCLIAGKYKKETLLPIVKEEGVVLSIKKEGQNLRFSVDAKTGTSQNMVPDYMMGTEENQLAFKVPLQFSGKKMVGTIPAQQLPTGILQVTIFNKQNQPLAERLVFINTEDYKSNGALLTDTLSFAARKKNVFSLNFLDTLSGNYAVSVTSNEIESNDQDNIVSRFLLSSDIKGYVFNPSYYFEKKDQEHADNLDLVMLTNGWRRYTWNEILSNRFPSMGIKDPNYITVKGILKDPITSKPLANKSYSVFLKTTSNKNLDFLPMQTNSVGEFTLDGLIFSDTARLIIKSPTTKKTDLLLSFNSTTLSNLFYVPKVQLPNYYFFAPDDIRYREISSLYKLNNSNNFSGITLDEIKVKVRAKTEREIFEKANTTGRLGSSAIKEIDFLTEPVSSGLNILDYLKSKLTGVNITGGPIDYSLVFRNTRTLLGGPVQMNIFLDELEVRPADVATLKVSDVALVQVFNNNLSSGSGGTLAIFRKRDAGTLSNNLLANTTEAFVEGFSDTKEFFSPDYSIEKKVLRFI
ncbi:MAG: hypothetical protein ACKVOM_10595 [Ferruginibacter sp.]